MNIYRNMTGWHGCIALIVFISPIGIRVNHDCCRSAYFLAINTGKIHPECSLVYSLHDLIYSL